MTTHPQPLSGAGRLQCLWSLLTLVLSSPLMATAQTAPVSLEDVSRAMAEAQTVFSRFVQERHLSLLSEPLRSEGFLCFEKPGRIRWETELPYKSILVSDGTSVAQFEWLDENWQKLDTGLSGALQQIVRQIAGVMEGRYAENRREHEVNLAHREEGPVVTLVPKHEKMQKMIQSIEVHLAPDLKATRRVVLRERDGDYTEIRFSHQAVGLHFPARTFDQTAPAKLEEIKQAATRLQP